MEHRKRIDMTPFELGWTAVALVGLGTLLGWALFGEHRLVEWIFDSGNAAEWAAALGTWVIGYGAWRYAREAHKQRLTEYTISRKEQAARRAAKLSDMYLRTAGLGAALSLIADFHLRPLETRSQWHLSNLAEDGISECKAPIFSDEDKSYLPAEMMPTLRFFISSTGNFLQAATMVKEHVTGGMDDALEEAHVIYQEHLVERSSVLHDHLRQFDQALLAEMKS